MLNKTCKTCKQCQAEFTITDDDLAFLKKISPEFGGKVYEIPPPTLCPDCRQIRRMLWRNERSLYKRKNDKTSEEVVSIYSPEKTEYKIWKNDEWRKDNWDPLEFGREYNSNKRFFDQFNELLAFYLENKIPISRKHYDVRYQERFALRDPRKLHHRQCMCEESGHDHSGRCTNEFETTYAPDRPEKIYCEECYQKSVI